MKAPCILPQLPAMSMEAIDNVRRLEEVLLQNDQVPIATRHTFHAGVYARSVTIPAGVLITGALIKIATLLVISGRVTVYIGTQVMNFDGYHVLPAAAGRKQAFLAHTDTDLTMVFATKATTIEEAEAEFTDEAQRLLSRRDPLLMTGE